jgi:SAM-dependent methyltransferase
MGMCNPAIIRFAREALTCETVQGKTVLDVGSRMVQLCYEECGSDQSGLRDIVTALQPASYLGVDILPGEGVDEILSIYDLADRFGDDAFDVVLCTEVVEHVEDWRRAFSNLKRVTRELLLVTTRSPGFPYHGWPHDYWRYTALDLERIFNDFEISRLEEDSFGPGVLFVGQKPDVFRETDTSHLRLHTPFGGRPRLRARPRVWVAVYVYGLFVFRSLRRHAKRFQHAR